MEKFVQPGTFAARDPHVTWHNGKYYHCCSVDNQSLSMACSDTVEGLKNAQLKEIYRAEPGQAYSLHLWAPELHVLDGKCYIYYTADDGNTNNHRMYVLENGSDDPMQPYTLAGKIADATDKYAIDATVLHHGGNRYLIWSGREGDVSGCQKLYIAKMGDPKTLVSERVMISTPEYEWEKRGGTGKPGKSYINEGPYAFSFGGKQYLAYAAAGSWCEDYCIAVLELVGEDPMNPAAWKKYPQPVFSGNETVKGAGHCSIVTREEETYVFFHAWDREENLEDDHSAAWMRVAAWYGRLLWENDRFVIL